ncbi:MAG: hypothetical protein O7C61_06495 [SAR324 cluster bacterium]|nr:hypothetical protein [SAR324 cluster bacterium]
MRRIERNWLRRIPGYGEGPEEEAPRPMPGEAGQGPLGEGEEAQALGEDPQGEAQEAAGTDGAPEEEIPGEDAPELSIPEEVEQARKEREEPRGRGLQNLNLAPQAFALEGRHMRRLAARFARMVSKVAEDSADLPSQGDEEWDLAELRQRRFTGRLISQCRMTREKRKVAVVLDTSPSCEQQARLFGSIAQVAEQLGDCELYDAPNFAIHSRKLGEDWERLSAAEQEWRFERRVVLAFGDFDGIERICAASTLRGNRIYWFCCEERPEVMESSREYFVKHYKGRYFPATHLHSLMKAMGRVR